MLKNGRHSSRTILSKRQEAIRLERKRKQRTAEIKQNCLKTKSDATWIGLFSSEAKVASPIFLSPPRNSTTLNRSSPICTSATPPISTSATPLICTSATPLINTLASPPICTSTPIICTSVTSLLRNLASHPTTTSETPSYRIACIPSQRPATISPTRPPSESCQQISTFPHPGRSQTEQGIHPQPTPVSNGFTSRGAATPSLHLSRDQVSGTRDRAHGRTFCDPQRKVLRAKRSIEFQMKALRLHEENDNRSQTDDRG